MEKDLFLHALSTLLFSWGGDTPPEAIWAANDFLDYFEKVNKITLSGRFEEIDYQDDNEGSGEHNNNLLDEIKNLP